MQCLLSHKTLVVIPAFNEEVALGPCVEKLLQACSEIDVLIVDDGSTDLTSSIAGDLAERHSSVHSLRLPHNCGIGVAVQTGLIYAKRYGYSEAVQYDGDGQHAPQSLHLLLQEARTKQLDLCVGSRFLNSEASNFRSTKLRRVGIAFFAKLIGLLTGVRVTDPTSGYRVYGRRAIEYLADFYPDDYPEPEVLFWFAHHGLRVGEVPVSMNERMGGSSSIRRLRSAYYMAKVTLAILVARFRTREGCLE